MASHESHLDRCGFWMIMIFVSFPNYGASLDIISKPTQQSSSSGAEFGPEKAVDGDINTITHTAFWYASQRFEPWWRLDLEAVYCLRKITIVNRMDQHDIRLDGALVRAGLNVDRVSNRLIGTVDYSETDGGIRVTTVVADPLVSARYVSVDLPGSNRYLHMGEVMVEEFIDAEALASTAIPVNGALASQSSAFSYTGGDPWAADRAVDRVFQTQYDNPSCSQTGNEQGPWWKIDLTTEQCVQKIVLKSRDAIYLSGRYRFEGAVVRAGLSSVPTDNPMCGSPLTRYQAVANNWMEFDCNPPDGLTARYVSVDIPTTTYLPVCEIFVLPCDLPAADFTFVANPALVNSTGGNDVVLTAYKGPNDIPAGVTFGRQLATGGTVGLPPGASEEDEPSLGCAARSLRLPAEDGRNRVGVFYLEATRRSTMTRIQIILFPKDDGSIHLRPVQRTHTASVGDSVQLEMRNVNAPNTNYRWRHDEGDVMTSWNDQLSVSIDVVAVSDGGVYSCFASDQEDQQLHGITRLIVRGCSDGTWGPPSCTNTCRRCYNGGVCDASAGSCVCAPGFSGKHCEQVHGRNVFGQNARHRCSNTTDPHDDACRGRLFCLPDPYGCSCAAGFTGLDCMQECEEGMYGADCKQTCHCALGETCSKDTGECSNGVCASSFFGINCQCSRREASSDEVTPTSVSQRNLTVSWSRPPCGFQGGTITGYLYKLTHVSSGATLRQTNTTQTAVTVDDLIPYTEYGFQVAATTSTGFGPFSGSITIRTLEAEPTAPLNVAIRSADADSFTVEWTAPAPPHGNITNYDIAYWTTGNMSTRVQQDDIGTAQLLYQIINLDFNVTYSIEVRAKTSVGAGPWSAVITATVVGVPGLIRNLRLSDATEVSLTMDWDPPLNLNGPSVTYVVEYKTLEKPYQAGFTAEDAYIQTEADSAPFTRDGLEPGTKYELKVSAKNQRFTGNPTVLLAYTVAQRDPPAPSTPTMNDDDVTETTVTIGLASVLPQSDTYIESYVVEVKKSVKVTRRDALMRRHFEDSPDDYIAAEISKSMVSDTFVVGDSKVYGSYFNAPLQANRVYDIRVGSVSRGNGTEASVTFSEPLTVSVSSQETNSSAGLAAGLVVMVLVLVIAVGGVIVVYKRRRTKRTKHASKKNGVTTPSAEHQHARNTGVVIQDEVAGSATNTYMNLGDLRRSSPPTPAPEATQSQTTQPRKVQPQPTQQETTQPESSTPPKTTQPETPPIQHKPFNEPPPVRIDELADYITEKESAGEKGFKADYKTLPDGQLHPWTVARKPENKQRNRFANVIAYDHSRVVLMPVEDDPHSDYINACYIDGYGETDKYIASQGPNKASLKDIWRMVWQMNVDTIVMLTNPVENGKVKCLQYWPDTGATTFANITVTILNEQVFLDFTIRQLQINQIDNEDDCRMVKQFHYTTWPDMKPPEYPAPLLNFMRVVNAEHNEGRTLIHCSAGVGRTGTYICLESMLEQMKQEGQVNVLGFIHRMRQKRIMMVQTPEQYKFLFDALLASSMTGETTHDMATFRRQLTALKKTEPGSQETGMEKQFKALSKLRVSRSNESAKAGKLPENVEKNRFPDFFPADRARPFLMTNTKEDDNNYINASYVPVGKNYSYQYTIL
ncbi:receptor-type tyrosine-protein phosphatase T-like isoform X2 [Patiria miniata]|uniref:protein-tyrosine-phosphatase n=1 Tax=Patiria miniata TaxID=46514 RepID=A0A913Z9U8_PATMI|nr:receptor-type tyrosine-protein phosphatase T-like isoform X2 [Patiria miniata]